MNNEETETLIWVKAKKSGGSSGNCVEIAVTADGNRAIRDSKNPSGGILLVSHAVFTDFLRDHGASLVSTARRIAPGFRLTGAILCLLDYLPTCELSCLYLNARHRLPIRSPARSRQ
jgi:hypothetical protein